MGCKRICIRYKADRPRSKMRYISGQKRCQNCEVFINWQGSWCPCCGIKLRSSPRRNKKDKLKDIKAKETTTRNNIQSRK